MEQFSLTYLVTLYVEVFGADLLRYLLGAGGVYLLVNTAMAARLSSQKLRGSGPVDGQIRWEVLASLRTVAIFAGTGTIIGIASRSGLVEIYHDIESYGLIYLALSTAILIVAHDAWFYWSHRLLHHRALFRSLHRLHHKSHNPTPFTAYSFDVGEAIANALFLPLILLVLPAHPIALFIFVTHMILRNALGHCGIEVFPARNNGKPVFGWLTSVTHHDQHHAHGRYNMGLYFTWWDRWMGTEHPDYLKRFSEVAPRISPATVKTAVLCVVISVGLFAGRAEAFDLNGRYATPGLGAIITFEACDKRAKTVCAKLDWAWNENDMKGAQIGDVIADDLTFDGTAWTGKLINPENGWKFTGTIRSRRSGALAVRGCAGPVCVKQDWYSVATLRRILRDR